MVGLEFYGGIALHNVGEEVLCRSRVSAPDKKRSASGVSEHARGSVCGSLAGWAAMWQAID